MKKTQWIDLQKKIQGSMASFIAIVMFVTFGMAVFMGFDWSGKAITKSIDAQFEQDKLHDFEIFVPAGISEDQIEKLKSTKEISSLEASFYYADAFTLNDDKLQAKIELITSDIDCLSQIEGALPRGNREIVFEKNWAKENDVKVGDKIHFELTGAMALLFKDNIFTVCGLAESPAYISAIANHYEVSVQNSLPIDTIAFVSEDSFDNTDYFRFTKLLLRCDSLRGMLTESDEYKEESSRLKDIIDNDLAHIFGSDAYSIFTRNSNASESMLKIIIDMFSKLKMDMASMFLIIGILVCFSTISRLVYKDMKQIGTKKALGFVKKEVLNLYLLYSASAAIIGTVLGILLARFVIEPAFASVIGNNFLYEKAVYVFSPMQAIILMLIEIVCICLAAYIACNTTLKKSAIVLLAGGEPPVQRRRFYEKTKAWDGLSLFTKSVVNNLMSDRRRILATLIGIAGSTALVVCAWSFHNAIYKSFDYQFDKLQEYTGILYYNNQIDADTSDIEAVLKKEDIAYTKIYESTIKLIAPDGGSVVSSIHVPQTELGDFEKLYTLDGKQHNLDDGAWVSCAFANNYGLEELGFANYADADSSEHEVPLGGVYEFYMQCPKLIMSKELYKKTYGEEPRYNAFLIDADTNEIINLDKKLSACENYLGIRDYYEDMEISFGIIKGVVGAITYLYIALAILMAIFVLLNLFVMFVEEKKYEIITMMVNGYSKKHARRYISTDTVLLCILGIVLGIALGLLIGHKTVLDMTSDVSYYIQEISLDACLIGAVSSALLTTIMCNLALKRINGFKLADLNK